MKYGGRKSTDPVSAQTTLFKRVYGSIINALTELSAAVGYHCFRIATIDDPNAKKKKKCHEDGDFWEIIVPRAHFLVKETRNSTPSIVKNLAFDFSELNSTSMSHNSFLKMMSEGVVVLSDGFLIVHLEQNRGANQYRIKIT